MEYEKRKRGSARQNRKVTCAVALPNHNGSGQLLLNTEPPQVKMNGFVDFEMCEMDCLKPVFVSGENCAVIENSANSRNVLSYDLLRSILGVTQTDNKLAECLADTDDEEEDYIEYIFSPRKYFLQSLCQFCKESFSQNLMPCCKCEMVFYCSSDHLNQDRAIHEPFCRAICAVAESAGGHVYCSTQGISNEEYQLVRVNTINSCERILQRYLEPFEKEVLLFPRMCASPECREWRVTELEDCSFCKQISFCKSNPDHIPASHKDWCKQLKLFEKIITHQSKYGKITPALPSKVCATAMTNVNTINQVFCQLYNKLSDIGNLVFYTELTQIASPALTSWFVMKLSDLMQESEMVIHIIGAEQHFEIDTLQKWEVLLMHLVPTLQKLDIFFIGPELNTPEDQMKILREQRLCRLCQKQNKHINYYFENALYHDFVTNSSTYMKPSLVCYFNPGLYRTTGFNVSDTWPDTIKATVQAKCPVLVTSYTNYESLLDLKKYLKESDRPLDVLLPVTVNPFRSQRPERNFVSEHQAPLIYKNYYLFALR